MQHIRPKESPDSRAFFNTISTLTLAFSNFYIIVLYKPFTETVKLEAEEPQMKETVRAWYAPPEKAGALCCSELAALHEIAPGAIMITRLKDGGIAIYPSDDEGDRSAFDVTMERFGLFIQRPLELPRI